MVVYLGFRSRDDVASVTANGEPLRLHVEPGDDDDGLDWRSPHSALRLARAILAHHCESDTRRAVDFQQAFRDQLVMYLPDVWVLDSDEVEAALLALETLASDRFA